jgi:hypothetical protein
VGLLGLGGGNALQPAAGPAYTRPCTLSSRGSGTGKEDKEGKNWYREPQQRSPRINTIQGEFYLIKHPK